MLKTFLAAGRLGQADRVQPTASSRCYQPSGHPDGPSVSPDTHRSGECGQILQRVAVQQQNIRSEAGGQTAGDGRQTQRAGRAGGGRAQSVGICQPCDSAENAQRLGQMDLQQPK